MSQIRLELAVRAAADGVYDGTLSRSRSRWPGADPPLWPIVGGPARYSAGVRRTAPWRHCPRTRRPAPSIEALAAAQPCHPVLPGAETLVFELVGDEPVPERRIVTVDVQGRVDQAGIRPIALHDRRSLPCVEGLFGETQHPAGHRDGDTVARLGQGPAGTSVMIMCRPEAGWQAGPGEGCVTQGISDPRVRCLENDSSAPVPRAPVCPPRMT